MTRCDRCDAIIPADGIAYHIWIWAVARVNDELQGGPWTGIREAVEAVAARSGGLPEALVASDVHCSRSFLVCTPCKEHLLANPLNRDWPAAPGPHALP